MVFALADLTVPVVGAPMAGGPGTPALAAAVTNAGGLGFVPGGYLSPERFAEEIGAARTLTTGPIGVNVFVPQPSMADAEKLTQYAGQLEPLARHYGVEVGQPRSGDDDGWLRKLEVVADVRPEVVSFTFGTPRPDLLTKFRQLGILTLVTVTSTHEAGIAIKHGADGLVVQGPEAGGHRGTFAPNTWPDAESLDELLDQIAGAQDVAIVAAGGLGTAADVAGALRRGAVAAQVGTALLLCNEAGTNTTHRSALQDPKFDSTVVTRAFSGRYARGLVNDFTRRFDDVAPLAYPEVNQMTSPIRKAAVAADDPHGTSLWAGTAYRAARTGTAADIVAALAATG